MDRRKASPAADPSTTGSFNVIPAQTMGASRIALAHFTLSRDYLVLESTRMRMIPHATVAALLCACTSGAPGIVRADGMDGTADAVPGCANCDGSITEKTECGPADWSCLADADSDNSLPDGDAGSEVKADLDDSGPPSDGSVAPVDADTGEAAGQCLWPDTLNDAGPGVRGCYVGRALLECTFPSGVGCSAESSSGPLTELCISDDPTHCSDCSSLPDTVALSRLLEVLVQARAC